MSMHNDIERDDNKITVQDFLEQMGITAAVEEFLSDNKSNDLLHEIHADSCQALDVKIKDLPAGVQEYLNGALDHFDKSYDDFVEVVLSAFRQDLASRMYASYELLGDKAAFKLAYVYKEALKDRREGMENLLRSIAEEIQEQAEQEFIKSWLILLGVLETNEDRFALLKAVMGDEIPDEMGVNVIPVFAKDLSDAMDQIMHMSIFGGCSCGCGDEEDDE